MLLHNTAYCETILQNDRLILRPLLIKDATAISGIGAMNESINILIELLNYQNLVPKNLF